MSVADRRQPAPAAASAPKQRRNGEPPVAVPGPKSAPKIVCRLPKPPGAGTFSIRLKLKADPGTEAHSGDPRADDGAGRGAVSSRASRGENVSGAGSRRSDGQDDDRASSESSSALSSTEQMSDSPSDKINPGSSEASNSEAGVDDDDDDSDSDLYGDDLYEDSGGSTSRAVSVAGTEEDAGEEQTGPKIEKLLACRTVMENNRAVEEVLVKYQGLSYLHAEWIRDIASRMRRPRERQQLQRFRVHWANVGRLFSDESPFNLDYIEVDRIVAKRTIDGTTYYFVKWCSMSYEECTWECETDLADRAKIEAFERYSRIPSPAEISQRQQRYPNPEDFHLQVSLDQPGKNGNELRSYQVEGVNWLRFCWFERRSCILADEMGLGKTVQSIVFLESVRKYRNFGGPFLIVAPLSTIANWQREFEAWTDMNVIVYHGRQAARDIIHEHEFFFMNGAQRVPHVYKFDALITTYEMAIMCVEALRKIHFRVVVVDEAHRLKNNTGRLIECLRRYHFDVRLLMTGTPLQNNSSELWSLLNFLDPISYVSRDLFLTEFGDMKTTEQVEKIQRLLKPRMLRRLKADVEATLPPKEETLVEVQLTKVQKYFYRAVYDRKFDLLSKGATRNNMPSLMNIMMELRKVCNHPYLLNNAEETVVSRRQHELDRPLQPAEIIEMLIQSSGKLVLIDKLLPRLRANNCRVLIFSQMVRVLDILEDYLRARNYTYERFDGRARIDARQAAIDRFSKPDSDRFVFLLSTRAGGVGINLTAADTVIIFDSDWNPQNDIQALSRCHRIGQEKPVKIFRLVTADTYEWDMFQLASRKLGFERAVLQDIEHGGDTEAGPAGAASAAKRHSGAGASHAATAPFSSEETELLLRKGMYALLQSSTGDESASFCAENIDQILERRAHVITVDEITGAVRGAQSSTFAKASFESDNSFKVDVNDPEFWKKSLSMMSTAPRALSSDAPSADGRRKRTPVSRLGQGDEEYEQDDLDGDFSDAGAHDSSDEDVQSVRTSWNRKAMLLFEYEFMSLGWNNWARILEACRQHPKVSHRFQQLTAQDVAHVAVALLQMLIDHVQRDRARCEQFRTEALATIRWPDAPPDAGRQPGQSEAAQRIIRDIRGTASYMQRIEHHAQRLVHMVRNMYYLREVVIAPALGERIMAGASVAEVELDVPVPNVTLPLWWTPADDKALLVGLYRHGGRERELDAIFADPLLPFAGRARLGRSIQNSQQNESGAEPKVGTAASPDAAGDAPLLYATYADVLRRFRSLISTIRAQNDATQRKLQIQSRLEERRRLREEKAILRQRELQENRDRLERERSARQEQRIRQQEARKAALNAHWTKMEKLRLLSTICSFGLPSDGQWEPFRRLWTASQKSDEALADFTHRFEMRCRSLLSEAETKRAMRGKAAAAADGGGGGGGDATADASGQPSEEGAQVPVSGAEPSPDFHFLTLERARRSIRSIELMRRVRGDVLPHPRLADSLALADGRYMPSWWIAGEHDRGLLLGVAKYGVMRGDLMLQDPELPFSALRSQFAVPTAPDVPLPPSDGDVKPFADALNNDDSSGASRVLHAAAAAAVTASPDGTMRVPSGPPVPGTGDEQQAEDVKPFADGTVGADSAPVAVGTARCADDDDAGPAMDPSSGEPASMARAAITGPVERPPSVDDAVAVPSVDADGAAGLAGSGNDAVMAVDGTGAEDGGAVDETGSTISGEADGGIDKRMVDDGASEAQMAQSTATWAILERMHWPKPSELMRRVEYLVALLDRHVASASAKAAKARRKGKGTAGGEEAGTKIRLKLSKHVSSECAAGGEGAAAGDAGEEGNRRRSSRVNKGQHATSRYVVDAGGNDAMDTSDDEAASAEGPAAPGAVRAWAGAGGDAVTGVMAGRRSDAWIADADRLDASPQLSDAGTVPGTPGGVAATGGQSGGLAARADGTARPPTASRRPGMTARTGPISAEKLAFLSRLNEEERMRRAVPRKRSKDRRHSSSEDEAGDGGRKGSKKAAHRRSRRPRRDGGDSDDGTHNNDVDDADYVAPEGENGAAGGGVDDDDDDDDDDFSGGSEEEEEEEDEEEEEEDADADVDDGDLIDDEDSDEFRPRKRDRRRNRKRKPSSGRRRDRRRSANAEPRTTSATEIPFDEHGNPILPCQLRRHVIESLGTVVLDREAYHSCVRAAAAPARARVH